MEELFVLAILTIGVLVCELIQVNKENKILRNNYQTAMKVLADTDPKLKEYLEREGKL